MGDNIDNDIVHNSLVNISQQKRKGDVERRSYNTDDDIFKLSEVIQSIKESPSLLVAAMCDTAANYSKQFNERIIIGSGGGSVPFRDIQIYFLYQEVVGNEGIIVCYKNMCLLKHLQLTLMFINATCLFVL